VYFHNHLRTLLISIALLRLSAFIIPSSPLKACKHGNTPSGWRSQGPEFIENGLECALPPNDEDMLEVWKGMMAETKTFDTLLVATPILAPLAALISYETAARVTRFCLDSLIHRTWESVDGNTYQISILTPVVNGIVVPAVSIALGTMTATTVSTLRQRQVEIRNLLNSELCTLDIMRAAITTLRDDDFELESLFDNTENQNNISQTARLTLLMRDYVSRLIRETRPDFNAVHAKIGDNELAAVVSILFAVNSQRQRALAAADAAQNGAKTLMDLRSERLAKLAAVFPPIHYIILALCASSIIVAFLIESDQEVLRFLDALQLRLLFTMLVGAFAGLTALVLDLADIHKGSLRITPLAVQFFYIHDYLSFDLCSRLGLSDVSNDLYLSTSVPIKKQQQIYHYDGGDADDDNTFREKDPDSGPKAIPSEDQSQANMSF